MIKHRTYGQTATLDEVIAMLLYARDMDGIPADTPVLLEGCDCVGTMVALGQGRNIAHDDAVYLLRPDGCCKYDGLRIVRQLVP